MEKVKAYYVEYQLGKDLWAHVFSFQDGFLYYRNLVDAEKAKEFLEAGTKGKYRVRNKELTLPLLSVNGSPRLVGGVK